jgi:WD40 repeat protein
MLRGHRTPVTAWDAFAYEQTASGSEDGTVILWEEKEENVYRVTRRYRAHAGAVLLVRRAYDREGAETDERKLLLSVGRDGYARLWPADEARPDGSVAFVQNGPAVMGIDFHPDGRRLAVITRETLACYAFPGQEEVFRSWVAEGYRIAFDPAGRMIAMSSREGSLSFVDAASGSTHLAIPQQNCWALFFTPDGWLAAPTDVTFTEEKGRISLWDAAGPEAQSTTLFEDADGFSSVAVSPCGRYLAAARSTFNMGLRLGKERLPSPPEVWIWDLENHKILGRLRGHESCIWALAFSPDSRWLASGAGFYSGQGWGELKLWDLRTLEEKCNYPVREPCIFSVRFTADSKRLVSAGGANMGIETDDRGVSIWDLKEGVEVFRLAVHESTIYGLDFSPDGRHLATAGQDGTVRVWAAPGFDAGLAR